MGTLAEIEAAVPKLNAEELAELEKFVQSERRKTTHSPTLLTAGHSVLDIPPVHVGRFLKPFTPDDDLLGEMLEDRR